MEGQGIAPRVVGLDICGQVCPASLLVTLRRINENQDAIRRGELRLEVLTDSRDSVGTISEAAGNMGYRVVVGKRDGQYLLEISAQG